MVVVLLCCAGTANALASPSVLPVGPGLCAAGLIVTGQNTTSAGEPADCTDPGATVTGYSVTAQGANGTAQIAPDGTITYTPSPGSTGPDSFTFEADFSDNTSTSETVPVTVTPGPSCSGVALTTGENTPGQTVPSCTDPGAGPMTYAIASQPTSGTASVNGQTLTYTPNGDFTGQDQFTYTATAPDGSSDPATVTVTVNPPPSCANESGSTPEGQPVTIPGSCSDGTGATVSYAIASNPTNGTATIDPNSGQISYTPTGNFTGQDTLAYTGTSSNGTSAPATVTITVNPPPSCSSEPASTIQGQVVQVSGSCADSTGAPVSYAISSSPSNGTATIDSSSGQISYTPTGNFTGQDTLAYTGTSSNGTSAPATVTITVNTPPPSCANESASTPEGQPVTIPGSCSDGTGATVSYAIASNPANGTATIDPNSGQITYTPADGFSGQDTLSYDGTSSNGTSAHAMVQVSVQPAPPAPSEPSPAPQSGGSEGPPTATITAPVANADYYWQDVPVATFSCAHGSGATLQSCTATVDGKSVTAGQQLPDGIASHTMTVTATDTDGQTGTATATYIASLTLAPPVSITTPRQGASYHLGQQVLAAYACLATSHGPALRSCEGPVAGGKAIDTRTLGRHTFTVTALDASGNSTQEAVSYTVVPTTNRFTAGRPSVDRHGIARVTLHLPGPGLVTALATGAGHPGGHAFTYGRLRRRARRAGALALSVTPSRSARASIAQSGASTLLHLAVTYTPTGGKPRVVRLRPVRVG